MVFPLCSSRPEDGCPATALAGSFVDGVSPYGVLGMSGNVFASTADWYDAEQKTRSLRGGSWHYDVLDARTSNRYGDAPNSYWGDVGFRCVR